MSLDPPAVRTANVIRDLMERGFISTTAQTVQAILRGNTSGIVNQRLGELSVEAARLAELGKPLLADNPVIRALLADMDDVLQSNRVLIGNAGVELQQSGFLNADLITRQLALPGLDDVQLAGLGIRWNTVDPEVMQQLVGFVDNPAWEQQLASYGDDVIDIVRNQAIQGRINGWGPVRIASAITERVQGISGVGGISQSQAENMMRTLQMQSFRTAQTINRVANADILSGQIRIAALDDRTCLACVSLHGEELPLDERINDHHRGRCTSIPVVRGRPRTVASGEEWWNGRTEAQQLAQAGQANFNALQSRSVTLRDYVKPYDDPVFGDMLRESSLNGILGNGAQEFYARNQ